MGNTPSSDETETTRKDWQAADTRIREAVSSGSSSRAVRNSLVSSHLHEANPYDSDNQEELNSDSDLEVDSESDSDSDLEDENQVRYLSVKTSTREKTTSKKEPFGESLRQYRDDHNHFGRGYSTPKQKSPPMKTYLGTELSQHKPRFSQKRKCREEQQDHVLSASASQCSDLSLHSLVAVPRRKDHWESAVISQELRQADNCVGVTFEDSFSTWYNAKDVHPIYRVMKGTHKEKEGWISCEDVENYVWLQSLPRNQKGFQPNMEFRVDKDNLIRCTDLDPDACLSARNTYHLAVYTPDPVESESLPVFQPPGKKLCIESFARLYSDYIEKQGLEQNTQQCEEPLLQVGGESIERTILHSSKETIHRTFAEYFFEGRMRILERNVRWGTEIRNAEKRKVLARGTQNESHYELLLTKLHKDKGHSFGQSKCRMVLYYVCVEGPNLPRIDLKNVLEQLADFGSLKANKAAARLQLFQTPAMNKSSKVPGTRIFGQPLTSDDFQLIDEKCHEGCGFIPRSYLDLFCGTNTIGKRTRAIQVRIFAANLGIFKGLLVEKPGILKIQLPSSMQKVGPSHNKSDKKAVVLIKGSFPSKTAHLTGRAINPELKNPPPASFRSKTISKMILRLWEAAGIPENVRNKYVKTREINPRKVFESYVVGVSDPTGKLPSKTIFIPGLSDKLKNKLQKKHKSRIFITRMPCMSASDGALVRVVTNKPKRMMKNDWEFLNSFSYGFVIFGDSTEGKAPLPNHIGGGDLDGDLYFVCWDDLILSELRKVVGKGLPRLKLKDEEEEPPKKNSCYNQNWLDRAQTQAANLEAIVGVHTLLAKLYNKSVDEDNQRDKTILGKAYQDAIDLQKHGGKVSLPSRLWEKVPVSLHKYLLAVDENNTESAEQIDKQTAVKKVILHDKDAMELSNDEIDPVNHNTGTLNDPEVDQLSVCDEDDNEIDYCPPSDDDKDGSLSGRKSRCPKAHEIIDRNSNTDSDGSDVCPFSIHNDGINISKSINSQKMDCCLHSSDPDIGCCSDSNGDDGFCATLKGTVEEMKVKNTKKASKRQAFGMNNYDDDSDDDDDNLRVLSKRRKIKSKDRIKKRCIKTKVPDIDDDNSDEDLCALLQRIVKKIKSKKAITKKKSSKRQEFQMYNESSDDDHYVSPKESVKKIEVKKTIMKKKALKMQASDTDNDESDDEYRALIENIVGQTKLKKGAIKTKNGGNTNPHPLRKDILIKKKSKGHISKERLSNMQASDIDDGNSANENILSDKRVHKVNRKKTTRKMKTPKRQASDIDERKSDDSLPKKSVRKATVKNVASMMKAFKSQASDIDDGESDDETLLSERQVEHIKAKNTTTKMNTSKKQVSDAEVSDADKSESDDENALSDRSVLKTKINNTTPKMKTLTNQASDIDEIESDNDEDILLNRSVESNRGKRPAIKTTMQASDIDDSESDDEDVYSDSIVENTNVKTMKMKVLKQQVSSIDDNSVLLDISVKNTKVKATDKTKDSNLLDSHMDDSDSDEENVFPEKSVGKTMKNTTRQMKAIKRQPSDIDESDNDEDDMHNRSMEFSKVNKITRQMKPSNKQATDTEESKSHDEDEYVLPNRSATKISVQKIIATMNNFKSQSSDTDDSESDGMNVLPERHHKNIKKKSTTSKVMIPKKQASDIEESECDHKDVLSKINVENTKVKKTMKVKTLQIKASDIDDIDSEDEDILPNKSVNNIMLAETTRQKKVSKRQESDIEGCDNAEDILLTSTESIKVKKTTNKTKTSKREAPDIDKTESCDYDVLPDRSFGNAKVKGTTIEMKVSKKQAPEIDDGDDAHILLKRSAEKAEANNTKKKMKIIKLAAFDTDNDCCHEGVSHVTTSTAGGSHHLNRCSKGLSVLELHGIGDQTDHCSVSKSYNKSHSNSVKDDLEKDKLTGHKYPMFEMVSNSDLAISDCEGEDGSLD